MAINLEKGERVEIGLSKLKVEMGWKVNPNAQPPYDLDASTFLLRANGEIGVEEDFVFYGSQKKIDTPGGSGYVSADGSVVLFDDSFCDDDDYDVEEKEIISLDLLCTSPLINEIVFTLSIYWRKDDPSERHSLEHMQYIYILIRDAVTGEQICRYELDEPPAAKGIVMGRLYRNDGFWMFEADGTPYADGLEQICRKYASNFM